MLEHIDDQEVIRRWDRFADTCANKHDLYGDPHKEVLLNPVLFSLMGSVSGKKVLDAGCGEGYLSRLLANQGAYVTAVDYAPRML